jgi:hypothetical protein
MPQLEISSTMSSVKAHTSASPLDNPGQRFDRPNQKTTTAGEVLCYTERTQRQSPAGRFPLACDGDAAATGGIPPAAGPMAAKRGNSHTRTRNRVSNRSLERFAIARDRGFEQLRTARNRTVARTTRRVPGNDSRSAHKARRRCRGAAPADHAADRSPAVVAEMVR